MKPQNERSRALARKICNTDQKKMRYGLLGQCAGFVGLRVVA